MPDQPSTATSTLTSARAACASAPAARACRRAPRIDRARAEVSRFATGLSTAIATATAVLLGGCALLPPPTPAGPVAVRLLAFNDLHGHLEPGSNALTLPDPANPTATVRVATGGAAFLAGKLAELRQGQAHHFTVSVGDLIGGTPLASALFRDEPTIEAANRMGVGLNGVGNHEFDKGLDELRRMVTGGCAANAPDAQTTSCPVPGRPYTGARFADDAGRGFLAANVVAPNGEPVFPAVAVRRFGGVPVGFIGVVTQTTPTIVVPSGVAGLRFLDEAETINRHARELQAQGVKAIVALVHEGGSIRSHWNDTTCPGAQGPIFDIARKLDPQVDVVFSAHSHQGYNCRVDGRIVMQAFSFGRGISQVDLVLDRATGDVDRTRTTAVNVPVVNNRNPPDVAARFAPATPDAGVQALVDEAVRLAMPRAQRVIGRITTAITRTPEPNSGGDFPAGRLIADSQLAATRAANQGGAQLAFMNPGGVRADFACTGGATGPCDITFGAAFTVQPFGNSLVVMTLTGAQIKDLLEQQHTGVNAQTPRMLQPSAGFRYRWAAAAPAGARASELSLDGQAIDPAKRYRVTVNSFLADGGDGFSVLTRGTERLGGAQDLDAMIDFLRVRPGPVAPPTVPRIIPA